MYILIISIFVIGYFAIALEGPLNINKSAVALLTGVLCWTAYIVLGNDNHLISEQLTEHLGELAGILFFLLGAMTIVELIDAHNGFDIITSVITTTNKRKLLWIICLITFILSALLDNLTTTIVMVSLLRKLIDDKNDRLFFVGMVVIAANSGGAWSPIGDVTTTMLWIGGQVTASNIILKLIMPSIISLVVPLAIVSVKLKGYITKPAKAEVNAASLLTKTERNIIFFTALGGLIFVPVFKSITHLPPFMGILLALGVLWIVTELIHRKKEDEEKENLSVVTALQKIDTPSILFFLGILLAIASLQSTGLLNNLAQTMDEKIGNLNIIVPGIGLLSAIVDNVPLVAATMGMYDLNLYPTDSYIWEFLAYCAGTGGSILIIGSAAGVAAMGLEKIDFMWYFKKISWLALIGYFAGALFYIVQQSYLH